MLADNINITIGTQEIVDAFSWVGKLLALILPQSLDGYVNAAIWIDVQV